MAIIDGDYIRGVKRLNITHLDQVLSLAQYFSFQFSIERAEFRRFVDAVEEIMKLRIEE